MDNSTQLTVLFSRPPHGNAAGREGLDLLLLNGSYEVPSAAVFVGDGVYQLLDGQQPDRIDSKNHIATFKALPMYDVETIIVCNESLSERGLTAEQLIMAVELKSPEQIAALIACSKEVLRF